MDAYIFSLFFLADQLYWHLACKQLSLTSEDIYLCLTNQKAKTKMNHRLNM